MIGATYKHRDGGWSVSIHGEEADVKAFEELLRWIDEHDVSVRESEVSEETKRYQAMKAALMEIPDLGKAIELLAKKAGLTKSILLTKAILFYESAIEAHERGETVAIRKKDGTSVELPPGFI